MVCRFNLQDLYGVLNCCCFVHQMSQHQRPELKVNRILTELDDFDPDHIQSVTEINEFSDAEMEFSPGWDDDIIFSSDAETDLDETMESTADDTDAKSWPSDWDDDADPDDIPSSARELQLLRMNDKFVVGFLNGYQSTPIKEAVTPGE